MTAIQDSQVLDFATKAHEGQVRKYTGVPYISHPIAVAEIATKEHIAGIHPSIAARHYYGHQLTVIRSISYLHDVIEDTDVTESELLKFLKTVFSDGSEYQIFDAVVLLTKKSENFDLFEYLDGIKSNYYAKLVKLADNTHNSSDLKNKKKAEYYKLIRFYLEN